MEFSSSNGLHTVPVYQLSGIIGSVGSGISIWKVLSTLLIAAIVYDQGKFCTCTSQPYASG